jgi:hypothetical protein
MTRLSTAIETCVSEQLDTADAVIRRTRALASIDAAKRPNSPRSTTPPPSTPIDVPLPDLSRFDQLLGRVDDSPVSVFYA